MQKDFCFYCGTETLTKNTYISQVGPIKLCYKCTEKYLKKCFHCKTLLLKDNMVEIEGKIFCAKCILESYGECSECRKKILKDKLIKDDYNRKYCNVCYYKDKLIRPYNFSPETFKFYKINKDIEENLLYCGFELEVEPNAPEIYSANNLKIFLKDKKKYMSHYYFKHDGSIKGFEIVSHPATFNYLKKEGELKSILEYMIKAGYTSYYGGRCGLHIHVNRDFFNDNGIIKLRLFFTQEKDKLQKLSKRYGIGEDRYCKYIDVNTKEAINGDKIDGIKYYALNLSSNHNTIEFRIFRGTLNYDRFISSLEFVDALCHFVMDDSIGVSHFTKKGLWEDFINWCKFQNKYNNFLTYWYRLNKEKMIEKKDKKIDIEEDIEAKTGRIKWRDNLEYKIRVSQTNENIFRGLTVNNI